MDVSKITQKKIGELLEKERRIDGRGLHEWRKIEAEVGFINTAEGSARVKFGDSEVIAGVKLSVGEPYTDSPDQGTLITTVELSPLASEDFELGPPKIGAIELARIVDRGIRESSFIDFKKLCIKKGELVWSVFLDIYPINEDGNLLDVCALASILALKSAVFPKFNEKENRVEFGSKTKEPLPLSEHVPVTITSYKIDNKFIFDPVQEEEKSAIARLAIAITRDKDKENYINALQKGGEALTEKEIFSMIETSIKESKKLFDIIDKIEKVK